MVVKNKESYNKHMLLRCHCVREDFVYFSRPTTSSFSKVFPVLSNFLWQISF